MKDQSLPLAVSTAASLCWCAALFASAALSLVAQAGEREAAPFRVGFSRAMFTDVNENDAKAALIVWGQTIIKERGIQVDPDTRILKDTTEILQALQDNSVDALDITTVEYAAVNREGLFNPICVSCAAGGSTVQYLLLVHQESKIDSLAQLRGRTLVFHQNRRACLARPWLDALLLEQGYTPATEFAARVTQSLKLAQAVLPVFFRQSDACVVTRSGFETMRELNPQIGKQLKVIATSPEVVPTVLCFRAAYPAALKEQLVAAALDFHRTPAGRQVLTVFQSEKFERQPDSCLDSALRLLARYDRLRSRTNGIAARLPSTAPDQEGGRQ
jgi:ABC-type phosphate/phosphonate transport system substrate-binding protein